MCKTFVIIRQFFALEYFIKIVEDYRKTMSVGTNIQTINFNKPVQQNLQINKINNSITSYHRMPAPISFKGADISVQQSNTIEISSKKEKKDNNIVAKLLLGGLAIGGAIFAWIKLHKPNKVQEVFKSEFKNIESIRKNLSEIFEKDLTEKEADTLAKNYKKICETTNDEEFVEKLFEQLKTDYGFKNSHIKLEIRDFTQQNAPNWVALHTELGHLLCISRVDRKLKSRKELFDIMFHELKHHKQFETAIATDKLAYEDAVATKKIKEYTQTQIDSYGGEQSVINWLKNKGRPYLQPEFDRIEREIGQLPKDSPQYKKGLEYIEATKNYIQEKEIITRNNDYNTNILEEEAYKVSKLAKEIFDWLS